MNNLKTIEEYFKSVMLELDTLCELTDTTELLNRIHELEDKYFTFICSCEQQTGVFRLTPTFACMNNIFQNKINYLYNVVLQSNNKKTKTTKKVLNE